MKAREHRKWFVALTVGLGVLGWTQTAAALHPIQRNWEFQFTAGDERPFFVSAGESGVGQRAKLEGSVFIDDDDHGMPILREMGLRLRDVVSVNASTGEIIDPIDDPFVNVGDLLVDVLLNEVPHDHFGTLTQSDVGAHMRFSATGPAANIDEFADTQLVMDFIGSELIFRGSSMFTSLIDGEFIVIEPNAGVLALEPGTLDYNFDGSLDVADLDFLVDAISQQNGTRSMDLFSDYRIDRADVNIWLSAAARENGLSSTYLYGDTDLDGRVDTTDLNVLGENWQQQVVGWSSGDFTGDRSVTSADLNLLAVNWRQANSVAAVPEPASVAWGLLVVPTIAFVRRR